MKKIGLLLSHIEQALDMRKEIEASTSFKVEWVTAFFEHAAKLVEKNAVDILLVDIAATEIEGVSAISTLKAKSTAPIVVFTKDIEKEQTLIYEVLAHGATDVVKVNSSYKFNNLASVLQNVLLLTGLLPEKVRKISKSENVRSYEKVVLIGASTGGPLAISTILASLSPDFPLPIVIAQHLDMQFSSGLAKWFQQRSALPVKIAEDGNFPQPGTVYLCKADRHLILDDEGKFQYRIYLEEESPYMPSIDVFFTSFAQNSSKQGIALLLTGMGADGAEGLKALKKKGWHTIAEHEESCVVYGMPKAAVTIGATKEVLRLDQIPLSILSFAKSIRRNK